MQRAITKTCVAWFFIICVSCVGYGLLPSANAGPLLDWIKERCGGKKQQQPTGYLATSGSFTHAPTTLMPGQCQQTCLQTCQRVSVNYVPYTDYRTTWQRVPVTQYRPVTTTDPASGCTVTCMRPCTDYKWQLQRIPYTTYRPVYQTQNYQVPVTTITNDCGQATGCQTCGVPTGLAVMPSGGYYTSPGGYPGQIVNPGTGGMPADNIPILGAQVQPAIDPYAQTRSGSYRPTFPPAASVSNPYANTNAYSGISSYSNYQAPVRRSAPPVYYPPVPSGFDAPQPEIQGSTNSQRPADRTPVLESFEQPSTSIQPPKRTYVDALQDPNPSLRWEYNTPTSGHPADQSVHHDVQEKWNYNPVRLVSYTVSPAIESPAPVVTPQRNADWTESPATSRGLNSDWN